VLPLVLADRGLTVLLAPSPAASHLLELLGVDSRQTAHANGGVLADRLAIPTYDPYTWHSEPPRSALRAVRLHAAPIVARLSSVPSWAVELAVGGCAELLVISRRRDRDLPDDVWVAAAAHLGAQFGAGASATAAPRRCVHALHADGESTAHQLALFGRRGRAAADAPHVRVLIGSHGANLANMLWSPGPLAVVEVSLEAKAHRQRARYSNYWHLCRALGFEHFLLPVVDASALPEVLWRTVQNALRVEASSAKSTPQALDSTTREKVT